MDSAATVRALAVLVATAGLGASGCGGAAAGAPGAQGASDVAPQGGLKGAPRPKGPPLTEGEPREVHERIAAALSSSGQACRVTSDRVLCKGDADRTASFYVVYRPYPARLLFGSPWLLKVTCEAATPSLNRFNWAYDELSASCDEKGALVVSGSYFVPEAGLSARDIVSYARWWSLAEVRALSASEVAPLLQ